MRLKEPMNIGGSAAKEIHRRQRKSLPLSLILLKTTLLFKALLTQMVISI